MQLYTQLKLKYKTVSSEIGHTKSEEKRQLRRVAARRLKQKPIEREEELIYNLHHHRTHYLKNVARSLHIARGFFSGLPYNLVETARRAEGEKNFLNKIVPEVVSIVYDYKSADYKSSLYAKEEVETWLGLR